ncbi:MAG: sugar phosphate isomerase/epimerase family protein [Thermoprotei archaeon]
MSKVNLAWLYAITKYGYPPSIDDVHRAIDDAKRLGFRAMELEVYGERNLKEFEERKKEIKDHISLEGLKVVNLAGIFRDLITEDQSTRERGLSLFKRACDLAVYFDSPMIQTDTFTPPLEFVSKKPYSENISFAERYEVRVPQGFSWERFWKNLVVSMKQCSLIAKDHGLTFSIEPRVGETISNSDAMLWLIKEVSEDNFGAVLDAGHLHAAKELLPLSVEKLGEHIVYVHLSDNDGRDNFHRAPGNGNIEWDSVFEGLRRHGFSGYVAIDVGGKDIPDLDSEVTRARSFAETMYDKYLKG